ncbi:hypothetical protein N2152v2_010233 [Parachlorella kessleri]
MPWLMGKLRLCRRKLTRYAALAALLPQSSTALPAPRSLALATLHHPYTRQILDKAMVVRFPGPRSFTGEDCAELHVHGGPAVVRSVLDALGTLPWARPADPGEFSRRAFEAGKLDLTQVEGLADLLRAETEAQRRQALAHSSGEARRRYEAWRGTILTCLARVEVGGRVWKGQGVQVGLAATQAVIDFGEDEGIADDVVAGMVPLAHQLRVQLEGHLGGGAAGELIREGVRVVIVGAPNAGKSSLLNALAGRDAAIVSPLPGTTRDTLEVALDLGGYKVIVTDTAGLRESDCPIEAEGVRRAYKAVQEAHIVLDFRDATADTSSCSSGGGPLWDTSSGQGLRGLHPSVGVARATLRVFNKVDRLAWARGRPPAEVAALLQGQQQEKTADQQQQQQQQLVEHLQQQHEQSRPLPVPCCAISCLTGEGLDGLLAQLKQAVQQVVGTCGDPTSAALVTRARHRHYLEEAVAALRRYEAAPLQVEIAAEELRFAAKALGRVTGAIDTEAVLDSLFSEFCIGK